MRYLRALLLLVACLAGPAAMAAAPQVSVTLEPAEATIDRPIVLRVRVEAAAPITAELPELDDARGQWTVLAHTLVTPEKGTAQSRVWEQRWELQALDVGTLALPALEILIRGSPGGPVERLEVRPPPIRITSVLDGDPASAMPRDIGAPVALPERGGSVLSWLIVAVIGLLAVLGWWRRRRETASGETASAAVEPSALAALDRLAGLAREAPERAAAVITETTEIVRRFLEADQGLPATRRTREELEGALPADGSPLAAQRARIGALMALADAVKFARGTATTELAGHAVEHGRQIVLGLTAPQPGSQPAE